MNGWTFFQTRSSTSLLVTFKQSNFFQAFKSWAPFLLLNVWLWIDELDAAAFSTYKRGSPACASVTSNSNLKARFFSYCWTWVVIPTARCQSVPILTLWFLHCDSIVRRGISWEYRSNGWTVEVFRFSPGSLPFFPNMLVSMFHHVPVLEKKALQINSVAVWWHEPVLPCWKFILKESYVADTGVDNWKSLICSAFRLPLCRQ